MSEREEAMRAAKQILAAALARIEHDQRQNVPINDMVAPSILGAIAVGTLAIAELLESVVRGSDGHKSIFTQESK